MNRPLPFSLFFALLFLFQSINLSSSPAPSPLFGVGGGGFLVCLFFFFFAFWSFTALSTWAASYFSAPIFIPPTPSRENIVTIRIFFFFFLKFTFWTLSGSVQSIIKKETFLYKTVDCVWLPKICSLLWIPAMIFITTLMILDFCFSIPLKIWW